MNRHPAILQIFLHFVRERNSLKRVLIKIQAAQFSTDLFKYVFLQVGM